MKFKHLSITLFFLLVFSDGKASTPYHWECGTFTIDATDTLIYCPQISTNYIYFTISNTGTTDIYVRQIINSSNLPTGWSVNMCNPNGCWGSNVLVDTFLVPASSFVTARFDFHADIAVGSGVASVRFDDSANPSVNGATLNLHAISLTPISVTVFADDTNICPGTTVYLTAVASGGDGIYSYVWVPGIGSTEGPLPYAPFVTTTITVIVTDASGSPAGVGSVVVTVNPVPLALFSGVSLSGCAPLNTCFTDLSVISAGGAITQWLWDFGDGSPVDTSQNPCHIYTVPSAMNSYNVALTTTSNTGCSSSFTINNYVASYPVPIAAFTATPQYVLVNQAVQFNNISNGATSWYWDFGDGYQDASQNPLHYYYTPGNYLVCLMTSNIYGCADTLCDTVYVVTGIDETQGGDNFIFLYPNPVINELGVRSSEFGDKSVLTIFNTLGQGVYRQRLTSNVQHLTVSVADLPSGVYFIKIKTQEGIRTAKFIKQ